MPGIVVPPALFGPSLSADQTWTGTNVFTRGLRVDIRDAPYNAVPDIQNSDGQVYGTTNFTSATANFVAGDVGKAIWIARAKTDANGYYDTTLHTTIAAVISTTQVTLAAASNVTAAGRYYGYGPVQQTAIIQQAIDDAAGAAGSTGRGATVLIVGSYGTNKLTLKNRVILAGRNPGRGSQLRLATGTNDHMITNLQGDPTNGGSAMSVGVRDLMLECNSYGQTGTSSGIYLRLTPMFPTAAIPRDDEYYDPRQRIDNVFIENPLTNGVDVDGRSETVSSRVYVEHARNHSFAIGSDNQLTNCVSSNAGHEGFYVHDAGGVLMVGCSSFYSGSASTVGVNNFDGFGFKIYNCVHGSVSLVGCESEDNWHGGYYLDSSQFITLAGCNADSNSRLVPGDFPALDIWASSYSSVTGLVATDRLPATNSPTQTSAVRLRNSSRFNQLSLTHGAGPNITLGAAVHSGTDSIDTNTLKINGQDGVRSEVFYGTTPAAGPTLGQTAGGVLGARTRFARITWLTNANAVGGGYETAASAETSFAISANNLLTVTIPAFPAGVLGAAVYVGATTNTETKQANAIITSAGTWTEPVAGYSTTGVAYPTTVQFVPDPYQYGTVLLTLAADLIITNPVNAHKGAVLRFVINQDGTGGRMLTWGANYTTSWIQNTAANRRDDIQFVYDGSNWSQISQVPPLVKSQLTVQAGDTINTTAVQTNFATGYVIPANQLKAGQTLRIRGAGVWGTLGSGTVTQNVALRGGSAGTTSFATAPTAITLPISQTNRGWWLEALMVIVSTGSSGTAEVQGTVIFGHNTAANTHTVDLVNTAPVTINTTALNDLRIAITHGASSVSNTSTQRLFVVEVLDQ